MVSSTLQVLSGSLTDVTSRLGLRQPQPVALAQEPMSERSLGAFEQQLGNYLHETQILQVKRAYFFAEQAHYGQVRRSGEPYVTHPLAVARVLASMHMDHQSLMAALLHLSLIHI